MNLARKAFEVITTPRPNTGPSLLQAAFAEGDWETVMTILCLSPRKLDALIALSSKGGESILHCLQGAHSVNSRGAMETGDASCSDSDMDVEHDDSDSTHPQDATNGRANLPHLPHFQEQEDPSAMLEATAALASRTNAQNPLNKTITHEADTSNHKGVILGWCVVNYLVEARDVLGGNSIIHLAARNGQVYHVERLLKLGADIEEISQNPHDKRATPLLTACALNESDVVGYLISRGADINAKTSDGMGALHLAALNGRRGTVELLINQGLDIEESMADGKTALHIAAEGGSIQVASTLLTLGANIEARDSVRETPLFSAIRGKRLEAVEHLLKSHCNVQAKARLGETPMHIASETGHAGIIQLLIRYKAGVNAKNRAGRTPLMVAASRKGSSKAVTCLLANGSSVDDTDAFGRTALHVASDRDIARILVENGADPSVRDLNRQMPLSMTIFSRNTETAKYLMEVGSNLDWRDVFGNTALHYAVEECLVGLSFELIKQGARIEFQNGNGETPVDIAIRHSYTSIIQLFKDARCRVSMEAH